MGFRKIKITQGKYAIVDAEDYDRLATHKWQYKPGPNTGYARRSIYVDGVKKSVHMHSCILDCPKGLFIDHINRNGLDNRKKNLRVVTRSQNQLNSNMRSYNTSGYRGVTFNKREDIWRAQIVISKKYICIGKSNDKMEAVKMYKDFISKTNLFG